ncbi:MAG TPA: S-adenosylmethionine decarboxylase [Patescibacteria group bacterium]
MAARYHIIIDVSEVSEPALVSQSGINRLLTDLPAKIDMKILHGPVVIEGIPENPGVTGFVVIDFSHISVHTFTQTSQALVDIFSCKKYSQNEAEDFVLRYFGVTKGQAKIQVVSWG